MKMIWFTGYNRRFNPDRHLATEYIMECDPDASNWWM
jgi:hypothetical protein